MSDIFSSKGFTLLEVLISITILALLGAALYGSYFTVARARERAADGMEARHEVNSTLDLLRRECDAAMFGSSDKRLRFVVEDRDNFGRPASNMEITTVAPPSSGERSESGVVNVSYRMEKRNGRYLLLRQERDIFLTSEVSAAYPQMEHISSFLVECYDGSRWLKSWDTALNGRLPVRVRFTLEVEENGKMKEFSMLAAPKAGAK